MKLYLGMSLIIAGALLGGTIEHAVSESSTARAASNPAVARGGQASMDTTMQAKSSADREMNEAMMHMTRTMDSTKMTGDADRDFMVMMIPHHQAAIDMAKIELRNGKRPLVKTLAHNIIDAQAREIKLMHSWLRQWYGNASG